MAMYRLPMAPIKSARFIGRGTSYGVGEEVWATQGVLLFESALMQKIFEVEDQFVHDYGSVPRFLQPIVPRVDGIADRCYILHDWLVRNRKLLGLSLVDCHAIFLESMMCVHVPEKKAKAVYRAVYCVNWMIANKGDGTIDPDMEKRIHPALMVPV